MYVYAYKGIRAAYLSLNLSNIKVFNISKIRN